MIRLAPIISGWATMSLSACGQSAPKGVSSIDVRDPDGYLSLYARDATYFDPFGEQRVDGLDELNARMAPMRGMKLPFTEPWNATEVNRVMDGEWRIIHTHRSLTQPKLAGSG